MTVKTHIGSSALLGLLLYYISSSFIMASSAFLSGILIDLDHLLDFLILSGEKFSIKNLFGWCNEGRWKKITLIFHSYELFALYAVAVYYHPHPLMVGVFFGVGLHLLLDQIGNRYLLKNMALHQLFYFLTFRVISGFRKERLRSDRDGNEG